MWWLRKNHEQTKIYEFQEINEYKIYLTLVNVK